MLNLQYNGRRGPEVIVTDFEKGERGSKKRQIGRYVKVERSLMFLQVITITYLSDGV